MEVTRKQKQKRKQLVKKLRKQKQKQMVTAVAVSNFKKVKRSELNFQCIGNQAATKAAVTPATNSKAAAKTAT